MIDLLIDNIELPIDTVPGFLEDLAQKNQIDKLCHVFEEIFSPSNIGRWVQMSDPVAFQNFIQRFCNLKAMVPNNDKFSMALQNTAETIRDIVLGAQSLTTKTKERQIVPYKKPEQQKIGFFLLVVSLIQKFFHNLFFSETKQNDTLPKEIIANIADIVVHEGITNLGNTCFLNSSIQALCNDGILHYLEKNKNSITTDKQELLFLFVNICKILQKTLSLKEKQQLLEKYSLQSDLSLKELKRYLLFQMIKEINTFWPIVDSKTLQVIQEDANLIVGFFIDSFALHNFYSTQVQQSYANKQGVFHCRSATKETSFQVTASTTKKQSINDLINREIYTKNPTTDKSKVEYPVNGKTTFLPQEACRSFLISIGDFFVVQIRKVRPSQKMAITNITHDVAIDLHDEKGNLQEAVAILEPMSFICYSGNGKGGHYYAIKKIASSWFLYDDSVVYPLTEQQVNDSFAPFVTQIFYRKTD